MKFKKIISILVMFGFLSNYGFCLPKKCCKTEFQKNVEDIVRSYLRGQLNQKLIKEIYGDKLKVIPNENEESACLQYDIGCYEIEIHYIDSNAKKNDVTPKSFWIYAKDGDDDALPLSVFFNLCGNEVDYEPRSEITTASFKYIEGDSPYIIRILVKNVYVFEPRLKKGSGRTIELTRYPKEWDIQLPIEEN